MVQERRKDRDESCFGWKHLPEVLQRSRPTKWFYTAICYDCKHYTIYGTFQQFHVIDIVRIGNYSNGSICIHIAKYIGIKYIWHITSICYTCNISLQVCCMKVHSDKRKEGHYYAAGLSFTDQHSKRQLYPPLPFMAHAVPTLTADFKRSWLERLVMSKHFFHVISKRRPACPSARLHTVNTESEITRKSDRSPFVVWSWERGGTARP